MTKIQGAVLFNASDPACSLDICLASWVARMDDRFPLSQMSQVNRFNNSVPHDWDRIIECSSSTLLYLPYAPLSGGSNPP